MDNTCLERTPESPGCALNIGTYLAVPAIVALIVFQAFIAPPRPLSLCDAWAAVRRCWKPLLSATRLVVGITAAWSLLLIVPGVIAAMAYVLYAPVVVMEDCGARVAQRGHHHRAAVRVAIAGVVLRG